MKKAEEAAEAVAEEAEDLYERGKDKVKGKDKDLEKGKEKIEKEGKGRDKEITGREFGQQRAAEARQRAEQRRSEAKQKLEEQELKVQQRRAYCRSPRACEATAGAGRDFSRRGGRTQRAYPASRGAYGADARSCAGASSSDRRIGQGAGRSC